MIKPILAVATFILGSLLSGPLLAISIGNINYPGGVASLMVPKISEDIPTVRYGLKEPAILDNGDEWQVLIGLDLTLLPGEYLVYVQHVSDDENTEFLKFQVDYKHYPLSTSPKKGGANSKYRLAKLPKFKKLSDLDFSNSQPPILPMQLPFTSQWNTEFGQLFASEEGQGMLAQDYTFAQPLASTLVLAPQAAIIAKVTLAESDTYSVVLDHGRGVFSVLHGLSDLTVEVGNGVVAGAVLGKVPSKVADKRPPARGQARKTAITMGTKVYWQVQLNGVFVNPLLMTQL